MLRRSIVGRVGCCVPWQAMSRRTATTTSTSFATATATATATAVDSILFRSLKEHYLEVSKMTAPPKVSPPSGFEILKGSLNTNGAVLNRTFGREEINIYVMRLAHTVGNLDDQDEDDDAINQLFLHVDVSKPGQTESLHFLCALYPDALSIHSVSMRPKLDTIATHLLVPSKYTGPVFEDLDEKMRDAFHSYIEERGVNENLFPFLQAWLYVKDHRNLMRWFKSVGTFIKEKTLESVAK